MTATRVLLTIVALLALIAALPAYMFATATPVHPEPQKAPSALQSQPSAQWSDAVNRAQQIARAALSKQNLPGLSAAVGIDGDIVWAEGFGWADLKQGVPVTPATRFRIGTASTALTSAAVGLLGEEGRLNADDEIRTYVPQVPQTQSPVTVRQLMERGDGGSSSRGDDGALARQRCERPVDALLDATGDARYGWIQVSAAIEAAAGQPFLTFMHERVFQPRGMNDTGAESAKEENPEDIGGPGEDPPFLTLLHDLILEPLLKRGTKPSVAPEKWTQPATIYAPGWGPKRVLRYGLHAQHPRNLSCYAGAMAFYSTPSDLVRFSLGRDTRNHDGELRGARVVSLLTSRERGIVVAVTSNSDADTSALARNVAEVFTPHR